MLVAVSASRRDLDEPTKFSCGISIDLHIFLGVFSFAASLLWCRTERGPNAALL